MKLFIFTLFILASTASCYADFIIGFSLDDGVSFSDSAVVEVGQTVGISVYLRQDGDEDRLTSDGLQSFGLRTDFTPGSVLVSNLAVDSSFFPGFMEIASGNLEFSGLTLAPPKAANVRLASFDITATFASTTTFSFTDLHPDPEFADFTLGDFPSTDIDGALFDSSFEFQLTAVPEPTSLILVSSALCGFGLVGCFGRRNRRHYGQSSVTQSRPVDFISRNALAYGSAPLTVR